jgi:hypothetical protein
MIEDIYNLINENKHNIEKILNYNNEELYILIDTAIISNNYFDIAKVSYMICKETIKVNNHTWYELDKCTNEWKKSTEGYIIKVMLSTEICMLFLDRAAYYQSKYTDCLDKDEKELFKIMSDRSIKISLNLKNTKYKDEIMKYLYSILNEIKK